MAISTAFRLPIGNGFATEAEDGDGFHVEAGFGWYNPLFGGQHLGDDWNGDGAQGSDAGLAIRSISNGTVVEAGVSEAFGNYAIIRHDLPYAIVVNGIATSSVYSLYGHLGQPASVAVGATVSIGQQIGVMGDTGMADGNPHLHLEMRLGHGAGYENMDGYAYGGLPAGWVDPSEFIELYRTVPAAGAPGDAGNTLAAAKAFAIGATPVSFSDSVSPTDAKDFYRFTLGASSDVQIAMAGLSADADLYLRDAAGNEVAHSWNWGNAAEFIGVSQLAAGAYYVEVRSWDPARADYTITMSARAAANDDLAGNTMAQARAVALGAAPAVFEDKVSGADTKDFYTFITAGSTDFVLSLDGLAADADVYLLDSSGRQIASSENWGASPESIEVGGLAAGTYFVEVRSFQSASTSYSMSMSAAPAGTGGGDQAGNTLATARSVNLGAQTQSFNDRVSSSDRLDYYSFTTTGKTNFQLAMNGMTADADVYLLDAQGREIAHSYNYGNTAEAISVSGLAAGSYFVLVQPFNNASTAYTLSMSAAAVAAGATQPFKVQGEGKTDLPQQSMHATASHDRLFGTKGDDRIGGLGGNDRIDGSNGDDALFGGRGFDRIDGGAGDDRINGGLHLDILTGDAGHDLFDFNSIREAGRNGGRDRIVDFDRAEDRIDLRGIDADGGRRGNQKFDFIGRQEFSGDAGELRYYRKGGDLIVEGDVNGDGRADFQIELDAIHNLSRGDFLL
jgi:murein DD-endopeptidase MepM/ murein hydrolase activator NlpD